MNLNYNWVPHDEGILSHSAERILHGEVPHRDFDEPYTGGLAYLDAAALRIFGTNLISLRYVLFLFFLAWVPAVYAIAHQLTSHWHAAAVALLAVVWSVPNYPAAMPSWYCLFFTTFGTLAILHYLRRRRPFWLILAGAAGACSFLVKSHGLLYVAGAMLFLAYAEQSLSEVARQVSPMAEPLRPPRVLTPYFFFLLSGLLLFAFVLLKVIMTVGGGPEFFHFVFPVLAIVAALLVREFRAPHRRTLARFRNLAGMLFPFLLGFAFPVCLFFVWFWWKGALHELTHALTVLQLRRVQEAQHPPPEPVLALLTVVWIVVLTEREKSDSRKTVRWLKVLLAMAVLLVCSKIPLAHLMVFESFASAVPVLVLAGLYYRHSSNSTEEAPGPNQLTCMLLVCVTAMASLVQFPFSTPLYFCYTTPLVILSLSALLAQLQHVSKFNWKLAGVFAAFFAVFLMPFEFVRIQQYPSQAARQTAPLNLPPARGLRVQAGEAAMYNTLVPFVVEHSRDGQIIAGPDCPEVYFLTGFQNHSRYLFEFLDDPEQFERQTTAVLRENPTINVAVVNQRPPFSLRQRNILTNLVRDRFPKSRKFGDFIVYWRE